MSLFVQDCNGDGVTNCDDYLLIHYNGGGICETPINEKGYKNRYNSCRVAAIAGELQVNLGMTWNVYYVISKSRTPIKFYYFLF
jgi:hypothetical protein